MPSQTWGEVLISSQIDGSALTAAATASMLPSAAEYVLPANFFKNIGQQLLIKASGRISCAVTTPGTARYQVMFGATSVFDTTAMNLNIVAKSNVNWYLELLLTARAIGTSANLIGQGYWMSEAVIASPLPTVGGSGVFTLPYNTAAAVGSNFDSTATQQVDVHFTQTVATGSMTCHQYSLVAIN
jgi:hypothetical protein